MSNNGPVMKFRAGGVEIAIWLGRNGNYNATVRTQYRDKATGEWKESKNWYLKDLRCLLEQCKSAIDYMHEKEGNKQIAERPISQDFAKGTVKNPEYVQGSEYGDDDISF